MSAWLGSKIKIEKHIEHAWKYQNSLVFGGEGRKWLSKNTLVNIDSTSLYQYYLSVV